MSQGEACRCSEKNQLLTKRRWLVYARNGNASAFNGGRWQFSRYSGVRCFVCGAVWRTRADYVDKLKDQPPEWRGKTAREMLVMIREAGQVQ